MEWFGHEIRSNQCFLRNRTIGFYSPLDAHDSSVKNTKVDRSKLFVICMLKASLR